MLFLHLQYYHCSPPWLQHLWNSVPGGKLLYQHLLSINGVIQYMYLPERCHFIQPKLNIACWNTARTVSTFSLLNMVVGKSQGKEKKKVKIKRYWFYFLLEVRFYHLKLLFIIIKLKQHFLHSEGYFNNKASIHICQEFVKWCSYWLVPGYFLTVTFTAYGKLKHLLSLLDSYEKHNKKCAEYSFVFFTK